MDASGLGLPTSSGTANTISTAQILTRYPEFPVGSGSGSTDVIEQNLNAGSSYYESLNVRVQKRLSKGLSVTFNFMKSKMIDQTNWLNDTDPRPEHRISPFDHPTRIAGYIRYELPIGRNRLVNLNSRWVNFQFGGWIRASTYTYQTGAPLTWVKFQYHIRNFSSTFAGVRQDGINDVNLAMLKEFNLGERKSFRIQCDSFNAINHPRFGPANTTASNTAFGTITAQSNRPRLLQIGARLLF